MDVLEAIKFRRSCRKYSSKQVSLDQVGAIVEAAGMAPSSGNQQPWKFVVVRDPSSREAIAEACLEQYWMSKAPVHIVVVAEEDKMKQLYGIRGEKLYSIQNCAAAIQNILLAAENFGLSTCWVGAFEESIISRVCSIPDSARPQAVITLGYSAEKAKKKILQPLPRILGIEGYGASVSDISPFAWDWGTVIRNEVDSLYNLTIGSLVKKTSKFVKKNFKSDAKNFNKNVGKMRKKVKNYFRRE